MPNLPVGAFQLFILEINSQESTKSIYRYFENQPFSVELCTENQCTYSDGTLQLNFVTQVLPEDPFESEL